MLFLKRCHLRQVFIPNYPDVALHGGILFQIHHDCGSRIAPTARIR
jgi:hypothetical protein